MGNLAFFFFPFFFLLEAVENIYFNFHSWHISSATWNVCAIEHHKLPWDGSPSGRIWASKYSQNQRAASWSLPCHPSQDLCQAFRTLFQTWSLFFFWWSYKERQKHFNSKGSAQAVVISTQADPYTQSLTESGELWLKHRGIFHGQIFWRRYWP